MTKLKSTKPVAGRNGFTLIELLVVLAIIVMLMGFGIPAYKNYFKQARAQQIKSDLLNLASRMELYRQATMTYSGALTSDIYSDSRQASKKDAYFDLFILVQDGGRSYLLKAEPLQNSPAKDDGTYWYNPRGINCWFATADASYSHDCSAGEAW